MNEVTIDTAEHKVEFVKLFVSDYRGFQPMDDQPDPICRFSPFRILGIKGERDAGHYICRDPKIYERLRNHRDYGKGFKEVKRLPTRVGAGGYIINTGVAKDGQGELKQLKEEEVAMLRELGHLEQKYLNEEGQLKSNVKKDAGVQVMARIVEIKKQLNLVD